MRVPSYYEKNQLPSLSSTQIVYLMKYTFNKIVVHWQQVGSMSIMFIFQETRKSNWMWKMVFMTWTINWKKQHLSMIRKEDSISVYQRLKVWTGKNRQALSGIWFHRENCHHWWLQERNIERVLKSNKYYFIIKINLGCNNEVRQYM